MSFQTISKWERQESFTDIALLPGMAKFFGVSMEVLFGIHPMQEATSFRGFSKRKCFSKGKNMRGAEALLREALKVHPGNYALMSELALCLAAYEIHESKEGRAALEEALDLCGRTAESCKNEKVRSTAAVTLCYVQYLLGNGEAAKAAARALPHVWESRELVCPDVLGEKEKTAMLKKSVATCLSVLCEKIRQAGPLPIIPGMIASGPSNSSANLPEGN